MMAQEAAQEINQDQTALDQAPQHIPVGLEPGEVVTEARRDGFCGWISKALIGEETAGQRAGGKGKEQGLLDATQTRHGTARVQGPANKALALSTPVEAALKRASPRPRGRAPRFERGGYDRFVHRLWPLAQVQIVRERTISLLGQKLQGGGLGSRASSPLQNLASSSG